MTIQEAQRLAEKGDIEAAWNIIKELMNHDPNDANLLIAATFCQQKAGNWPLAYHLAKASIDKMPNRPEPYINLAAACDQLYLYDEGIKATVQAERIAPDENLCGTAVMNQASLMINNGRFKEALPICERAVKVKPTNKSYGNLGMAQLANGLWEEGWKNYDKCLGSAERMKVDYGVPDWNGEPGTVIVYGEQGLGDEISFASMLPDILATNSVVIDCDYRLKGLFQRSFPKATVTGGRWVEKYKGKADYQCSLGQLGRFYRNKDEDFPRKPYLVADEVRAAQWKYVKECSGKPLVGLAWTGGLAHTGSKFRTIEKHVRADLLKLDAEFVSLEYKPRGPINGVSVYPHATLTEDYDDTAALVSQCDLVITVQTAVAHLAGALGVPCIVMVPETSQWRYAAPKFLWYTENFHVHKAPWNIQEVLKIAKHYLG